MKSIKNNFTIREFEAILTTRILSNRMATPNSEWKIREKIKYNDFLQLASFVVLDFVRELDLNEVFSTRINNRTNRLFFVNNLTGKVIFEIGVDFENKKLGKITRPKVVIVSKNKLPKVIALGV